MTSRSWALQSSELKKEHTGYIFICLNWEAAYRLHSATGDSCIYCWGCTVEMIGQIKWKSLLKIDQLSDLRSLLHYRISNVKKKLMHSTNFSLGTLVIADCWSQDTDSIRKDNNMHKQNSTE